MALHALTSPMMDKNYGPVDWIILSDLGILEKASNLINMTLIHKYSLLAIVLPGNGLQSGKLRLNHLIYLNNLLKLIILLLIYFIEWKAHMLKYFM